MTLSAGTRLGPYEILAPIGAGGMGEVYRAKDPKLDRFVAIKVLPELLANDAKALSRFEREAKALAALQHPNVLGIFDFGREGTTAYAVMELLEGETLRGLPLFSPTGMAVRNIPSPKSPSGFSRPAVRPMAAAWPWYRSPRPPAPRRPFTCSIWMVIGIR